MDRNAACPVGRRVEPDAICERIATGHARGDDVQLTCRDSHIFLVSCIDAGRTADRMRRLKLEGVAASIDSHIIARMCIYRCQYVGGQIACCIVGFLNGNNGILIESIGRIIICIVHIVIFICISTRYLFREINIVTSFHDSIRINSSRDRNRWRRQSFCLDRSQSRFIPVNGIWLEHGHEVVL